jgi:HSP20 family protein
MSTTLELLNPVRDFTFRNFLLDDASIGQWTPRVDVVEANTYYQISAELPGIEKSQVKITFENNTLNISGEKIKENKDNDKTYHKVERYYGKFDRSIYLGNQVTVDKIDAEFKNGLLIVNVIKKPEAQPQKIEIK